MSDGSAGLTGRERETATESAHSLVDRSSFAVIIARGSEKKLPSPEMLSALLAGAEASCSRCLTAVCRHSTVADRTSHSEVSRRTSQRLTDSTANPAFSRCRLHWATVALRTWLGSRSSSSVLDAFRAASHGMVERVLSSIVASPSARMRSETYRLAQTIGTGGALPPPIGAVIVVPGHLYQSQGG